VGATGIEAGDESQRSREEKAGYPTSGLPSASESDRRRTNSSELGQLGASESSTRTGGVALDADEADLEARLVAAELAGRTTLALALERRLERLRAQKAAGNVVVLHGRRPRD
jgi:hypothetical protein